MHTRRHLLALAAGLSATALLAGCDGAGGGGKPVSVEEEMFLGKANAPVTIYEYASVACPVCAQWNNEVLPKFKAKYIDTGEVKLVLREMNAHNPALSTAGFLLARCAGKDKYFEVVDAIYHAQQEIEQSGDAMGGLSRIAKANGISENAMRECVTDPKSIEAQNNRVVQMAQADNITGTPTFMVDGQIVAGGFATMEQLDGIVAAAKARKTAKAG